MRSFFFLTLMTSVIFTEIYLFIEVSAYLHILIIFALIVGTAMIGLSLAKTQSISAFSDLKHIGSADSNFFIYMIDGIGALGAGLLLLLPGFGTDLIGLLLLVPRLRKLLLSIIFQYFLRRTHTHSPHENRGVNEPGDTIIEGEFKSSSDPEKKDGSKLLF